MMRFLVSAVLSLAIVVLVIAQLACHSQEANRPAPPANMKAEVIDTAAIEKEIMRIENDWPRVFKEKDAGAVKRLYADDIIIIYPDGRLGSKTQDIEDVENGNLTFEGWQVLNINVKVIDNDTAVATGRTIITKGKTRTADGKSVDSSGEFRWFDTFQRRNSQWKIVGSASVPLLTPIGAPSPSPSQSPSASASASASASPQK
jgi:ketosteroid isomerase-like protein